MAERDVTGRVIERVQRRIERLRNNMALKIPYGPKGGQLSPQELRLKIQNMDPTVKLRIIQTIGPEEWARTIEDLYAG